MVKNNLHFDRAQIIDLISIATRTNSPPTDIKSIDIYIWGLSILVGHEVTTVQINLLVGFF